jgi:hypothetical protein
MAPSWPVYAPPLPGVDEDWDRATPQQLVNLGVAFVVRYCSYDHTGKNLTASEANVLASAGLWIVTVWEYDPDAPLNGYPQGVKDATAYIDQMRPLGQPSGSVAYMALDRDFPPDRYPIIGRYLQGADSVLWRAGYRTGAYCKYDLGRWLLDRGIVKWVWQTYAWSGGKWDPRAQIRQVANGVNLGGHHVDKDEAEFASYGQWQPGRLPPWMEDQNMLSDMPIPGTSSPDHPGDRNEYDWARDQVMLRQMLVVGDVPVPDRAPLAALLQLPGAVANLAGQLGKVSAALETVARQVNEIHNRDQVSAAGDEVAAAIDRQTLAFVHWLAGGAVPPAPAPSAPGGTS